METQLAPGSDPLLRKKFVRVEMNNTAHLMHIADLQNDVALARKMMATLQKNAVYLEAFDPKYPGDLAHAQQWIHPYPAILARLESEQGRKEYDPVLPPDPEKV